jgi:environmental stress-induced protein Ves
VTLACPWFASSGRRCPPQPWKNGGGSHARDRLHARRARASHSFDWRVSIAHHSRQLARFRRLPGSTACIVLAGRARAFTCTRRKTGGIDHRLDTPLLPFAFPGDDAVHCTTCWAARAATDFNVMTRRGVCTCAGAGTAHTGMAARHTPGLAAGRARHLAGAQLSLCPCICRCHTGRGSRPVVACHAASRGTSSPKATVRSCCG